MINSGINWKKSHKNKMERLNDEIVDIKKVKKVTQSLTDAIFLIDTNHKLNELNQKCLSDKLTFLLFALEYFFIRLNKT